MNSRNEQIQILYEIVTSIDTELDLRDMLKNCLSIYARKLNCSAGAVFKLNQHSQEENYYFKEIVSIPRRIHNSPAYKDAIKQIPQEPNKQILDEFYKHLPISLHINENHHCHIMNLPGFGLIIFLKGGEPLKVDLLNSLLALNNKIAYACKSCLNIKALRESEQKYRLLAENTLDCIWKMGIDFKFTYVNPSVLQMLGFTQEEWIGSSLSDHCSKENMKFMVDLVKEEIKKGSKSAGVKFETYLFHKNDREIPVEITAKILFDKNEHPIELQGTTRDITERKQAEEKEKEYHKNIQLLSETAMRFVEFPQDKDIYPFIGDQLQEFTGKNSYIVINTIDEEKSILTTRAVLGMGKFTDKIAKLLGRHPVGRTFDAKDENLSYLSDSKLHYYEEGLYEILLRTVSKTLCRSMEKLLNVKKIYTIGFTKDNELFGTIIIALKEGAGELKNKQIIETFIKQASIAVQRKKAEKQLEQSMEKLRKAMGEIIQAMTLVVERRDPYTAGHQRRVADLARSIATEIGLSSDQINGVRLAGVIHDVGKIAVPVEILSKPGKISRTEFEIIKKHPQVGYDMLKEIEFSWPIAQIVFQHHERMDGSGYPNGLKGDEILLEARIIGVADVVEAMSSHRPYRPALGIDKALEEISQNKGILYDPEVVDACLKLFREKRFKF